MECGMYMEMQISICTMQIVVVVTTAVLCTEKVCVQPCTFDKRHTMVTASIEYMALQVSSTMLAGVMSVDGGVKSIQATNLICIEYAHTLWCIPYNRKP